MRAETMASRSSPGALEVVGQPPQRDLEDAATLAGPHGADVQARERPRLVAAKRVGQRGPRPDALGHVLHDRPGAARS